jgi:hypothetical protein
LPLPVVEEVFTKRINYNRSDKEFVLTLQGMDSSFRRQKLILRQTPGGRGLPAEDKTSSALCEACLLAVEV